MRRADKRGLLPWPVPAVCILDPDGDLVRRLRQNGMAKPFAGLPCYHTELDTFDLGDHRGMDDRSWRKGDPHVP